MSGLSKIQTDSAKNLKHLPALSQGFCLVQEMKNDKSRTNYFSRLFLRSEERIQPAMTSKHRKAIADWLAIFHEIAVLHHSHPHNFSTSLQKPCAAISQGARLRPWAGCSPCTQGPIPSLAGSFTSLKRHFDSSSSGSAGRAVTGDSE